MITFYGLSIAVPGCAAGDAVGTVFSPYDHRLFVDRSAFYSWFRLGWYRGHRHLAGTFARSTGTVWPPLTGGHRDDVIIDSVIYWHNQM